MTGRIAIIICIAFSSLIAAAKGGKVTVHADSRPAEEVFKSVMHQTGMNFAYSSDLLDGMKVTLNVTDVPLDRALQKMFDGTDIEYKIKGKNVRLKRKPIKRKKRKAKSEQPLPQQSSILMSTIRNCSMRWLWFRTVRMAEVRLQI